jgi:tetratricopeptide (TPR) repeat protein
MTEWYRRKTWTKIDEEEFFAKLGRARKDGRAQYLKIQAIELVDTKNKELLNVAKKLLNKMLTEYPDDNFNKGSALQTLGDIYKLNADYESAIDFYRQALDFEKVYPNVRTQAYLNYSELVVKTNKSELFDELEKILLEHYSGMMFLIEKYKVNSILSIINNIKGQQEKAKQYSDLAEQSVSADTSGLRYHKYLGVVKERDNWLDDLVRKK